MKKMVIAIILTGVCTSVFAQNPGQSSGVIRELSGTVELQHSGAASFVPAQVGDMLTENTVISTSFRSSALIEVGSALITVQPLTHLSLMEIHSSGGEETVNVYLQTGRLRVDVNPPAGTSANMTVRAPTTTASVRGTRFEMDTRRLTVREGSVSFRGNSGNRVNVTAGTNSAVLADGRPTNPHREKRRGYRPPMSVGHEDTVVIFAPSGPTGPVDGGINIEPVF